MQMQPEADFERRMFVYNCKGGDRYNLPVVSIAILGEDNAAWRPEVVVFDLWGCRTTFHFAAFKLLDWRGKEAALENHPNPIAVFVLAHLMTLATRGDDEARAGWKLRLAKNFASRPMPMEDRRQWFRLLDWLMELPQELNHEIWTPIFALEDPAVAFVSFFEREEKRLMDLAVQRGEKSGEERGELRGELRGERRGERRGLIRAVRALLAAKHGDAGLALVPRIEAVQDNTLLDLLLTAIEAGASVDALAAMLP